MPRRRCVPQSLGGSRHAIRDTAHNRTHAFVPETVEQGVWSLNVTPTLATAISLLAEGFFVRRVSLIGTKSSIVAFISMLCLLANGGMNIVLTVKAFKIEDIQRFGQDTKIITGVTLLLAAVADYLLAGSMILALCRNKSQHARASILEMLTVYILNTGLLTGTLQWMASLMSFVFPNELYWAPFGLIALRLYGITLLSVLNSRKHMASQGITIFSGSYSPNAIMRAHRLATLERFNVPRDTNENVLPVISVKVTEETEEHGRGGYGSYLSSTSNFHKSDPSV
ncbi:hypothetical protein GY45DRAFT_1175356 [Cubamyces sp. BRFM 1775]|nr:hypothetical protein GY45DRAFT_1175356 [Cubamyces sp. BRFM 1775]